MPRFVLCLLVTLELALVVWGVRLHSPRIPDLPPPPTYTPVENGSLTVIIGGNATVRSDQRVLIDCEPLIENVKNLTGVTNPRVTWRKNDIVLSNQSETNIVISQDGRFLIITATALRRGGELGTSGLYTCTVCAGDANIDCMNDTSRQIVCGEPHLVPPVNKTAEPSELLIILICGQDLTVPSLDGILTVIINCEVFNGSEPFTITVYEDDTIVGNSVPYFITDPKFATYTVVLTTEDCGATSASSRILQAGDPPSINTTMTEKPTTMPENKRVNVGSAVNIASGAILTIDCIATGTPPITIVWISGHDILQLIQGNSTSSTISSSITITVTNATDGDIIMCRADNNIGYDEATTTINVDVAELCFINGTYEFYEDQDLVCINLTLNKPAPCNMTVEVIEESVTATRGLDYESGPYFVNFAKGDKSAKLYINITDDNELEMNEEFTLRINKSAFCPNVSLAKPYEAKVIIMDNEYKFCFGQSSYLVKERGEVIFPVSLNRPLRKDITVNFTYVDLTATGKQS